jgi:hypothetical protein
MRLPALASFIVVSLFSVTSTQIVVAQIPTPMLPTAATSGGTPIRDPQALAVVQRSIQSLGGSAHLGQLQDCVVRAQVEPLDGSGITSGSLIWTKSGAEFRSDFPTAKGTATVATGHGKPFRKTEGEVKTVPKHVLRALFVPAFVSFALLAELDTPTYSIEYVSPGTVGAEAVTIVKTYSDATPLDSVVTPQTWYFDNTTGLPLRVEYRLPDHYFPSKYLVDSVDLSDYRLVSGILYPFHAVRSILGHQVSDISVSSVASNTNIPPSVFDAGGAQ